MQNQKTVLMLLNALQSANRGDIPALTGSESNLLALIVINGRLHSESDFELFKQYSCDSSRLLSALLAKTTRCSIITAYHIALEATLYDICHTLGIITEITASPVEG